MTRLIIAIGTLLVMTGFVLAQESATDSGQPNPQEMQFAVITLDKLDAFEAANLINHLEPQARVQVSESIGGLVLRGTAATIAQVREMIEVLESKMPSGSERRTEVLRIKNRRVQDILTQLRMTMGGECQLAGDDATGQLIVRGSGSTVEMVRDLVERLDQPQGTVMLAFDYLRVRAIDSSSKIKGVSLPPRLAGVDVALLKSGFIVTEMMGHTMVRCTDGEQFSVESSEGDEFSRTRYRIGGSTQFLPDADQLRITVETWVQRESKQGPDSGRTEREFQVETRLVTGFDEAVVLAALPSDEGSAKGSLVMVVRASRPSKQ